MLFRSAFILCLAFASSMSIADECIKDGAEVLFVGKISRETFPGPPNYESIRKGDKPETYWILTLNRPQCVTGEPLKNGNPNEIGKFNRFQLVLTPEQFEKNRSLLKQPVEVRGQLFQAITGHHHTQVLIEVKEMRVASEK